MTTRSICDVKIYNGYNKLLIEFDENELPVFHDRYIEQAMRESGIFIPITMRDEYKIESETPSRIYAPPIEGKSANYNKVMSRIR